MAKKSKDWVSFFVMAFLIFVGSHFLLITWYSSGPSTDISFGWFELHRHELNWHADNFDYRHLSAVVVFSFVFTWILEMALRHRIV